MAWCGRGSRIALPVRPIAGAGALSIERGIHPAPASRGFLRPIGVGCGTLRSARLRAEAVHCYVAGMAMTKCPPIRWKLESGGSLGVVRARGGLRARDYMENHREA